MTAYDFAIPPTGVPEFDRDHERLILLIREVRRQLHAGRRPMAEACGRQAYALLLSHMAREEAFLRQIRYPWLEEHCEGKARLREAATLFVARLRQAHVSAAALLTELDVLAHQAGTCVSTYDARYGAFLAEQRCAEAAG